MLTQLATGEDRSGFAVPLSQVKSANPEITLRAGNQFLNHQLANVVGKLPDDLLEFIWRVSRQKLSPLEPLSPEMPVNWLNDHGKIELALDRQCLLERLGKRGSRGHDSVFDAQLVEGFLVCDDVRDAGAS